MVVAPPVAEIDPTDDALRIYAVHVVPHPEPPWPLYGIYLGRGLVITAAHVVGRWKPISIRFADRVCQNHLSTAGSDNFRSQFTQAARPSHDQDNITREFESMIGEIVETVSSASTELEASARTLTSTAERAQQVTSRMSYLRGDVNAGRGVSFSFSSHRFHRSF